jgi:hypothetical protein
MPVMAEIQDEAAPLAAGADEGGQSIPPPIYQWKVDIDIEYVDGGPTYYYEPTRYIYDDISAPYV